MTSELKSCGRRGGNCQCSSVEECVYHGADEPCSAGSEHAGDPKRKFAHCKNGHRSTVPHDAFSTETASTHSCPICGRGVIVDDAGDRPMGDYPISNGLDPLP